MARRKLRGSERQRHRSFFRSSKSPAFSTRHVVARGGNTRDAMRIRGASGATEAAIIGNRFPVHAEKAEIISFREIDSLSSAILSRMYLIASRIFVSSYPRYKG